MTEHCSHSTTGSSMSYVQRMWMRVICKWTGIHGPVLCLQFWMRCYDFTIVFSHTCCATVSSCLMTRTIQREYEFCITSVKTCFMCILCCCTIVCSYKHIQMTNSCKCTEAYWFILCVSMLASVCLFCGLFCVLDIFYSCLFVWV